MAKNFSIILFLSLLLFCGSISYARPLQIGWNFSFRYYNDLNWVYRSQGQVEGYDLNSQVGLELFLICPVLENFDIEIAVEDMAPSQVRMAAAMPDDTVAYLPIYISGIVNWGKAGQVYPYFGAGINLTYMDEKFSGREYTPGIGYQFFMGASFGGGWRGEFGYALLNGTVENSTISQGAYSRATYFKLGYALSL